MASMVTLAELRTDFEHCREVWEEHGCFVVDDAIAPELLQRAEDAAWRVWGRVKGGEAVEGVTPGASSIGALLSPELGGGVRNPRDTADAMLSGVMHNPTIRVYSQGLDSGFPRPF